MAPRNNSSMLTGHWNATRFAQKPVHQPAYSFNNVPKAERDLKGSSLQRSDKREHFTTAMAEMALLCKEAVRRRPGAGKKVGSKPLSLEYLADRMDVDDPLFGYLVRTEEKLKDHKDGWKEGMLQGFITVTTFTNWQKTFRWDSLDEAAFGLDEDDIEEQRLNGERKWDEDGKLAKELQATVRCGDIWNEGIVWPRIAEISLLGALGCGKSLISIAIEELESMKACGSHNYDYVVLQATENSIPFYEAMGFIRVGGLEEDRVPKSSSSTSGSDDDNLVAPVDQHSSGKENNVNDQAMPCEIVTSKLTSYTVKRAGETVKDIALKLNVDAWDLVFLNKDIYGNMGPGSRLEEGTKLHVPADVQQSEIKESAVKWHVADENDTPRMIAKKFGVNYYDVVNANKLRLPGLMSNSRLKKGTRIKVSHFDVQDTPLKPYAHWSFPDDRFEDPEPSYMMARKLNRRRGRYALKNLFRNSLAVPVTEYKPTTLLIPPSPGPNMVQTLLDKPASPKPTKPLSHKKPEPPKRSKSAFFFFSKEQRRLGRVANKDFAAAAKYLADSWAAVSDEERAVYEELSTKDKQRFRIEKFNYGRELDVWKALNPGYEEPAAAPTPVNNYMNHLFNAVVRLKPEATSEKSEYKYWYVLTFIPDLKWCHLAPMEQVGTFGENKSKSAGRPIWKLVDEDLGNEIDVSSSYCIPVNVRSIKRTADADKEEWDIIDDGSTPWLKSCGSRSVSTRKRKFSSTCTPKKPRLMAQMPGSNKITFVKVSGRYLDGNGPGRGRPKGSKDKTVRKNSRWHGENSPEKRSTKNGLNHTKHYSGGVQLKDFDVLCGRGATYENHPGNIMYRNLLKTKKEAYMTCAQSRRSKIAQNVAAAVYKKGGRFLSQSNETGKWSCMEDRWIMKKIQQALSEIHPFSQNESEDLDQPQGSCDHTLPQSPGAPIPPDSKPPDFKVGDLVNVAPRSWPGVRCSGGVGHITSISADHYLSVRFVLDRRHVKEIEHQYVKHHTFDTDSSRRESSRPRRSCKDSDTTKPRNSSTNEQCKTTRRGKKLSSEFNAQNSRKKSSRKIPVNHSSSVDSDHLTSATSPARRSGRHRSSSVDSDPMTSAVTSYARRYGRYSEQRQPRYETPQKSDPASLPQTRSSARRAVQSQSSRRKVPKLDPVASSPTRRSVRRVEPIRPKRLTQTLLCNTLLTQTTRPKRVAAPSFLGESPLSPRKRRKIQTAH